MHILRILHLLNHCLGVKPEICILTSSLSTFLLKPAKSFLCVLEKPKPLKVKYPNPLWHGFLIHNLVWEFFSSAMAFSKKMVSSYLFIYVFIYTLIVLEDI